MSSNFMQHAPSHFPIIKPEPGMERSVSPHGSEHSHYSTSHQLSRPYPSPGSMQAPMAMSSSAMSLPSFPDMSAMPNMHYQQVPPTSMTMQQPPPIQQRSPKPASKNFPCRTCGKPFARRSDLVRHGTHKTIAPRSFITNSSRTYSQRCKAACLRPCRLRQAVHPKISFDCAPKGSHRRKTSSLRNLRKGTEQHLRMYESEADKYPALQ